MGVRTDTMERTAEVAGVLPEVLYTFSQFRKAAGVGEWGLRMLRRRGMPVRYSGGRGYVYGADFIRHVLGIEDAGNQDT